MPSTLETVDLDKGKRRWRLDDGWTPADPAWIGSFAINYGVTPRVIYITGVSDCLKYYWSGEDIFLSFQVERLRDEQDTLI